MDCKHLFPNWYAASPVSHTGFARKCPPQDWYNKRTEIEQSRTNEDLSTYEWLLYTYIIDGKFVLECHSMHLVTKGTAKWKQWWDCGLGLVVGWLLSSTKTGACSCLISQFYWDRSLWLIGFSVLPRQEPVADWVLSSTKNEAYGWFFSSTETGACGWLISRSTKTGACGWLISQFYQDRSLWMVFQLYRDKSLCRYCLVYSGLLMWHCHACNVI